MKRLLLFLLSLAVCINGFAQTDSIHVWNKWCAKKDTMLLFVTGNNVIQIYSPTIKPADIKIKSLDKSLRIGLPEIKGDTMSVIAMPFPEKGKKMRLAIQYKKNSKEIKTINFVSDSIPQLMAKVGNLQVNEALKKDILTQVALKAYFPNSLYSYPYGIRQYTFKVTSPTGSAIIPVKGFYITREVLTEINNAPVGTNLQFTDIKATCPECALRPVKDVNLKIK
jgi:hypothetical protein